MQLQFLTQFKKVIYKSVNDTGKLLNTFHFKVSNKTRTVQTLIPVEPFQNVSAAKKKVGIVTYDSNQQFNVKFFILLFWLFYKTIETVLNPFGLYYINLHVVCVCVFTAEKCFYNVWSHTGWSYWTWRCEFDQST